MAARNLNLTPAQYAELFGYFSNPKVKTFIEVQAHPNNRAAFGILYKKYTGKSLLRTSKGYSEVKPSSDKWGPQYRVYFELLKPGPPHIDPVLIKESPKSKPISWKRIHRTALGDMMLQKGFDIGDNSGANVYSLVRSKIDPSYVSQFDAGYNLIP